MAHNPAVLFTENSRSALRWTVGWHILLFGAVYGVLAQIGLHHSTITSNVTLIWPPSGLALYVTLRYGWALWPGIVLGDLIGNAGTGAPLVSVLGISAGNIIETLLVAWLLQHRLDFHRELDRVRDVVLLLLVGSAGAVASAVVGPASLVLGGVLPSSLYGKVWLQWVMGDATGVIVFTPLLLAWASWHPTRDRPARPWEAITLALLLLATCEGVFGGFGLVRQGDYPAALAIFPLAVWAALRFGLQGATLVTLVVSVAAVWATVEGRGPFVQAESVDSLVRWWVFANVITVTSLVLAAARIERARAESDLAKERDFFSAVLDVQGALVVVLDRAGHVIRANVAFETLTGFKARDIGSSGFSATCVPPDQRDKVDGHLELLRVGVSNRAPYDASLRRNQGDPLLISWSNTAMRDSHGHLTHVILTGIDITERNRALEAVRTARRELEVRVSERTRDLAMANADLESEIAERRRLEREIIDIAEREQMRIGQELHDGLGQQLTAVAFLSEVLANQLAATGHSHAADALHIEHLVSDAVSQARRLARGLAPVELDANGLMAALEQLADTARSVFGIDCHFRCAEPVPVDDESVAINLYRIAQEAVTNAAKHSGGRWLLIELRRHDDGLELTITDDGTGFPQRPPAGHGMGLRTMRHRARLIGASITIEASAGKGVCVAIVLSWPDTPPAAPAPTDRGTAHA